MSNGKLPNPELLKEVLSSLFMAGSEEISSPARSWGLPRKNIAAESISQAFGWPTPTMHIPIYGSSQILTALKEMDAENRIYGHGKMLSGRIAPDTLPDQVAVLGRKIPPATFVKGIELDDAANEAFFDVADEPRRDFGKSSISKRASRIQYPAAA